MRPILTVGVTTHNEKNNITCLLDRLSRLDEKYFQVILYDDASTDGTADLIKQHPIAKKPNFRAHLSEDNFGSPSAGRQYIANNATSPYVTFVDGDDLIDPKALTRIARNLQPGYDIILTPFVLGRRRQFPKSHSNTQPISNQTISKILSGIGGKIYNREAVALHAKDEIKGRSEDVRLNMRILLAGFDRIRLEDRDPFYFIAASRKSTLAKNILPHEIAARVKNYETLRQRHGFDDTYIKSLHRNLLKVIREDPSLNEGDRLTRYKTINGIMPFELKTIIHLVEDISCAGGMVETVRETVKAAEGRPIRHLYLSARNDQPCSVSGGLCALKDESAVLALLSGCHLADTVVVASTGTIESFSFLVQEHLKQLPIIYLASNQLSAALQDSPVLMDFDYLEVHKACRILCPSDMDMAVHRQFGIHELTKIKLPVETRPQNSYSPENNKFVTYVGPIEFQSKGADRLIPIAKLMKERGLPPLHIFTTDDRNSPDLPAFLTRLSQEGLDDWVEINYGITNSSPLYGTASVLLVPSRKDALGTDILEAFSFGVPAIAPSYVPGPAELIRNGEDGFLLDTFSDGTVVTLLEGLTADTLKSLSQNCFSRHLDFSMPQYISALEKVALEVVSGYSGKNEVSVFPSLRAVAASHHLETQIVALQRMLRVRIVRKLMYLRIAVAETALYWRLTKPLRWLRSRKRKALNPSNPSSAPAQHQS